MAQQVHEVFRAYRTVPYKGAYVQMPVGFLPSGDIVQLRAATASIVNDNSTRKEVTFPYGTIWRKNVPFDDVYRAVRSGQHVTSRYGVGSDGSAVKGGELKSIIRDKETALAWLRFMRRMSAYSSKEQRALQSAQEELVLAYGRKRSADKITARERFARGLILEDSLGRTNPMAAALVTGAGLTHLDRRTATIQQIAPKIEQKTLYLYEYIQAHLGLYGELWDYLCIGSRDKAPGQFWQLLNAIHGGKLSRKSRGHVKWIAIAELLTEFREAFDHIVVRPFCRNAAHTKRDLSAAIDAAEAYDYTALVECLLRIREGIRWVFALDYLQMRVITPLSFSPHRQLVQDNLVGFITRLAQCSDVELATKVKGEVVTNAQLALESMHMNEWEDAKQHLDEIAQIL